MVKTLSKVDFKKLNEECDNKVLDLVKQKGFYPYEYIEYISDFEKFEEELRRKEKFYSSLIEPLVTHDNLAVKLSEITKRFDEFFDKYETLYSEL